MKHNLSNNNLLKNNEAYPTPYGVVYMNYTAKTHAIRLSGGLDSAVMLYMLAKSIKKNNATGIIRPLTVRRGNPTDLIKYNRVDVYPYVDTIIDWVRSEFPTVKIIDSVKEDANYWWIAEFVDGKNRSSYSETQTNLSRYLHWRYCKSDASDINDIIYCEYCGTTKNPNDPEMPQSDESHRDKIISGAIVTGSPTVVDTGIDEYRGAMTYEPFRNADKRITIWLANYLGILDKVLELTRSCEGDAASTNNFTKECMECWWCNERHWALKNYKNTDYT